MLIDCHTHVFSPEMIADREGFVARDPAFAALYGNPAAKMASAADLLASMEHEGVDRSWAFGFAWSDPDVCSEHNRYLVEAAALSNGRLLAFATIQPGDPATALRELESLAGSGVRGLAELRPADQGYSLDDAGVREVFAAARELGLVSVFHVTEPVGHQYPGKDGLELAEFTRFAAWYSPGRTVAAHWGGGLPFYALMPEVRAALRYTWFDTAATSLLYDPGVFRLGPDLAGAGRVLFGSDFPLLSQARQVERLKAAAPRELWDGLLGANAERMLTGGTG